MVVVELMKDNALERVLAFGVKVLYLSLHNSCIACT